MLTSVECWNVSRRHTNNQQARLADALQGFPFTSDRETDANDWWSKFESGGGGDGGGGGWIDADVALEADESFSAIYSSCYAARMQLRLGLRATGTGTVDDAGIAAGSDNVVDGWLQWLKMTGADYALSSRVLAEVDIRTGSARSAGSAANGAENDQLLAVAAQKVEKQVAFLQFLPNLNRSCSLKCYGCSSLALQRLYHRKCTSRHRQLRLGFGRKQFAQQYLGQRCDPSTCASFCRRW